MNFEEIQESIAAVQQPRSNFQLEKFVIGQHQTQEMQFYQVCIELQSAIYALRSAELDAQIIEAKIQRLLESGDEVKKLKAKKLQLEKEQLLFAVVGAKREFEHLYAIYNSFEKKFNRDEIEAAQKIYWEKRLVTAANAMLMGSGSVNPAHLEAMAQAEILDEYLVKKTELEEYALRNLES